MKNIWLMGGFGNVLFQVLAFNVLSKKKQKRFFYQKTNPKKYNNKISWVDNSSATIL